jgi:phosphohistidine phosphatase
MKLLTLLRHAKAVTAGPDIDDHARALNGRGRAASAEIGDQLAADRPDLILCSTAARTRETLALTARNWDPLPPVQFEERLYLAAASMLLARLRTVPAGTRHVLLVGHNPGIHDLARLLAGEAGISTALAIKFPTGARARFKFDMDDWAALGPSALRGLDIVFPHRD